VATALKEQLGIDADKRIITMPEEVKDLGTYTATVKFHPAVVVDILFDVVPEEA
jgi:large subunit ribosomal protein L9